MEVIAIDPNIFLEDRKITGTVLQSKFPDDVSPWFLTGFIEAEGNFDISVFPSPRALANTGIKYRFRVSANYKDIVLLCAVNNYFGTGSVSTIRKGTDVLSIEISSIETIKNIIIPFFEKYPLKGTKYYDYLSWKISFFDFLENRSNLDSKLKLIDRIKAVKQSMNNNKVAPIKLPLDNLINIDPNYISGFITGDGTFSLVTGPDSFNKGFGRSILGIFQHTNNKLLLEAISKQFKLKAKPGLVCLKNIPDMTSFIISNKYDHINTIIPFFEEFPVYGQHAVSFLKWSLIIKYLLSLRVEGTMPRNLDKPYIISNIRKVWLDKSWLINTDLTFNKENIVKQINDILKP